MKLTIEDKKQIVEAMGFNTEVFNQEHNEWNANVYIRTYKDAKDYLQISFQKRELYAKEYVFTTKPKIAKFFGIKENDIVEVVQAFYNMLTEIWEEETGRKAMN